MNNLDDKKCNVIDIIQGIILKYCPLTNDRLFLMDDFRKTPEFDIQMIFDKEESFICFLFGTSSFKSGIIEQLKINKYIDFNELSNLLNFILADHEFIKSINIDKNSLNMIFSINWTNESIKGISCGDITLNMNFKNNLDLMKQYIIYIFETYSDYLEKTPSFISMKNKYLNSVKEKYLDSLSKDELLAILHNLEESQLRELTYNLDNDIFLNLVKNEQQNNSTKTLLLKTNNK